MNESEQLGCSLFCSVRLSCRVRGSGLADSRRRQQTCFAKGLNVVRVGMMQPYFFPYLGYFSLIEATDCWVIFDTAQYIRRGWVNRNRVRTNGRASWKYVRVPVRHAPQQTPIRKVQIDHSSDWKQRLIDGLDYYRLRRAPHFSETMRFLWEALSVDSDLLIDLLVHSLQCCCRHLGLPFRPLLFSELTEDACLQADAGEWSLLASCRLNASCYINAPGGRHLFDAQQFRRQGIELMFLEPELPAYDQGSACFEPSLSIIDALMWQSPADVLKMIGRYELRAA